MTKGKDFRLVKNQISSNSELFNPGLAIRNAPIQNFYFNEIKPVQLNLHIRGYRCIPCNGDRIKLLRAKIRSDFEAGSVFVENRRPDNIDARNGRFYLIEKHGKKDRMVRSAEDCRADKPGVFIRSRSGNNFAASIKHTKIRLSCAIFCKGSHSRL